MKKIIFFNVLIILFCCSCNNNYTSEKTKNLGVCTIPNNVLSYIQSNENFELIDTQKQFSKDFWEYYNIQKKISMSNHLLWRF